MTTNTTQTAAMIKRKRYLWLALWLQVVINNIDGRAEANDEREHVHIKVHMSEVIKKPHHQHTSASSASVVSGGGGHKALRQHRQHHDYPAYAPLPPPPHHTLPSAPSTSSAVPIDFDFYNGSEDDPFHPFISTKLSVLPPEPENLAPPLSTSNYGPVLFGNELTSGTAPIGSSKQHQRLTDEMSRQHLHPHQILSPEIMSALTAAAGSGSDSNSLLVDNFFAELQREYMEKYGDRPRRPRRPEKTTKMHKRKKYGSNGIGESFRFPLKTSGHHHHHHQLLQPYKYLSNKYYQNMYMNTDDDDDEDDHDVHEPEAPKHAPSPPTEDYDDDIRSGNAGQPAAVTTDYDETSAENSHHFYTNTIASPSVQNVANYAASSAMASPPPPPLPPSLSPPTHHLPNPFSYQDTFGAYAAPLVGHPTTTTRLKWHGSISPPDVRPTYAIPASSGNGNNLRTMANRTTTRATAATASEYENERGHQQQRQRQQQGRYKKRKQRNKRKRNPPIHVV